MKKILLLFISFFSIINIGFGLNPGDLMIIAWSADADDGIGLLNLVDIPANTLIHFNDNEWIGLPVGAGGAFNGTTETEMTWNSGGAVIPAGSTILFREIDNIINPFYGAWIGGTLTGTLTGTLSLAVSDEVVYIFTGINNTTPSVFITAFANNGFSITNGQLTNTGLTNGVNATSLAVNIDVAEYTGITTGYSYQLQAAISDPANWITDDGVGNQSQNGGADFPPTINTFTIVLKPYKAVATSSTCGFVGISDTAVYTYLEDTASLWFKADRGTSCTTNGCLVAQWNDLSASGLHATQTAPLLQPSYSTNTTNFNPSVYFDGTLNGDILEGNGLTQGADVTIYVVGLEQNQATATNGSSYRPMFSTAGAYEILNVFGYDITFSSTSISDRVNYLGPTNVSISGSNFVLLTSYDNAYNIYKLSHQSNNTLGGYKNGMLLGTNTTTGTLVYANDFFLGGNNYNSARRYNGNLNEVIYIGDTVSSIFNDKIETYLAIKYGITLQHNYINSDTAVIYDVSNGFAHGIFGIGRNNSFDLYQPKSKSETDYSGIIIESTLNIGDENYLVLGHDNGAYTRINLAGESNVLTRKWYAEMTGGVGTITLELDLATIGANTGQPASAVKIGISNSPSFTNTHWQSATSVSGGVATFEGVALYDKYITFSAAL